MLHRLERNENILSRVLFQINRFSLGSGFSQQDACYEGLFAISAEKKHEKTTGGRSYCSWAGCDADNRGGCGSAGRRRLSWRGWDSRRWRLSWRRVSRWRILSRRRILWRWFSRRLLWAAHRARVWL